MKKTIDQLNLGGKKVIIRVDFNVPMKGKKITSNTRILAALPTIQKAVADRAKVILLSHLGRIKEEADLEKKSLKPVSVELSRLLKEPVKFVERPTGKEVTAAVKQLKPGEILMLENTRWEDLKNKAESKNDPALGKFWASLGDVFINDAFGTSHRAHASNVGITANIGESAIGYLVEKEIMALSKAIHKPARPAIAIIGGAKVSDKIKTIENLIKKVDKLIIGGGMAFTFWKAQGLGIGKSLVEEDQIELAKRLLRAYPDQIVLPVDAALSEVFGDRAPLFNNSNPMEIPSGLMGLDIGPKSIEIFKKQLEGAKTVIWNGPLGVTEFSHYSKGTEAIAQAIGALGPDAYTVVGGGDSVAAINKLKLNDQFSHISTGGGACLAMLEGSPLPGIAAIQEANEAALNVNSDYQSEFESVLDDLNYTNPTDVFVDPFMDELNSVKPISEETEEETDFANNVMDDFEADLSPEVELDEPEEVKAPVEKPKKAAAKESKEKKPAAKTTKKATAEKEKKEKPKKEKVEKAPKAKKTKEKEAKVAPVEEIEPVVEAPAEPEIVQEESTSDLDLRGGRRSRRRR